MDSKTIAEYCTGCGACVSYGCGELIMNEKGFCIASATDEHFENFCNNICMASGKQYEGYTSDSIWGNVIEAFYAWSTDERIRYVASSGGSLTAICKYLLEHQKVDGVILTRADPNKPIATETICCNTIEEILSCCGSRYSSSSPLINISQYTLDNKRYAFVGKPCDVAILRNLAVYDSKINDTFPIMLSFFCAGVPSEKANMQLLEKMQCQFDDCVSLKYRGDGWPGFATAIDIRGEKHQLPYREAWRDTLGRDIRLICRFCLDGIGDMADISCCDAWYMDDDKHPLFEEADGRNAVFCRTEIGKEIFDNACALGYIYTEKYPDYKTDLINYQSYQFSRRATMNVTMRAMGMKKREVPIYPKKILKLFSKSAGPRTKYRRFKGILDRIRQGII